MKKFSFIQIRNITYITIILSLVFLGCTEDRPSTPIDAEGKEVTIPKITNTSIVILGTIQDGGSPHMGCRKKCCKSLFLHPDNNRKVVSLGIIDPENQKKYIIEATPDFTEQAKILKNSSPFESSEEPDGVFLTHAHIGHYTGLMYLGREAMNTSNLPVYAMPKMKTFLEKNGPWNQLVRSNNIALHPLYNDSTIKLTSTISLTPHTVPHRDEYSETVGYTIEGPNKKALFIPDIDKWNKWRNDIIKEISKVDYAFLDATFYDEEEVNHRNISEIPHPFIIESMELFKNLSPEEKAKIHFIHFNHTNPLLDKKSSQYKEVINNGFTISSIYDVLEL